MYSSDVKEILARGIDTMGLHLQNQAETIAYLSQYFNELRKWNRKVNLVARTLDDHQILENHFLDSLTLLQVLNRNNIGSETVLDVGTGAGFPGLVLKAACPQIQVTLIEPRGNRYYFLKHIVRVLDLRKVELFNMRLEESVEQEELSGSRFSLITSRAFTDINRFVRLTAPYLGQNGRIVCMKGPGVDRELAEPGQKGLPEKFQISQTIKFQLPFSGAERTLVVIRRFCN